MEAGEPKQSTAYDFDSHMAWSSMGSLGSVEAECCVTSVEAKFGPKQGKKSSAGTIIFRVYLTRKYLRLLLTAQ